MKLPHKSLVLSAILLAVAMVSAQTPVDINFNTTYQTIRGYGGSTAWQSTMSSAQANQIFGTTGTDLGLSILRVRIDPSSTTGGSNWAAELGNAQAATARGAIVFATPWTPPAAWKTNGSTIGGELITSDYGAFANYLNLFTSYMKAGGVNLYAISVQNEPDFLPGTYESCSYTGTQMDNFIAQEGGSITTKLMMPESDSFNLDESDPTLNDSNAVGHVSIVAGHLYGASPFYYTNAKNHGKDVWETEHYLSPANGASTPAIGDAISAAEEIHNSMAVAQYNAYNWWWILDCGSCNLVDSNNNTTYYGDAIAQFSRFVRPGYVMAGANNNPTSGVYVTAYEGSGNYVIVAINSNNSSASLSFPISGATLTSVTPYETSSAGGLMQESAVGVSNNTFSYNMPAQSIVTFVGTGSSGGSCTPTSITPYISVSGSWAEESSATVSSTSTAVDLGPQPLSGGSWSWTGPNGFTSTSREIDNIPLSAGANVYTATYTNSCGSTSTQAFTITAPGTGTAITPYVQVNGGAWQETNTVTVASGSTVNLGPQPTQGGSWSWTGPNGFTSTSRQINSIPLSVGTDVFVATYTNTSGVTSTETFTITVTGGISTTGYYTIVNEASGSCIDDTGGGTANGTVLQQYACSTGNLNQEWLFTSVGGGYYEVTTHNSSTVGWNVVGAGTSPGTGVQLYTYYGGLNAQFQPVQLASGYYEFIDRNSGLCLNDPNGTTANGQQLQINTCNGSTSESWKLNLL